MKVLNLFDFTFFMGLFVVFHAVSIATIFYAEEFTGFPRGFKRDF